MLVVKFGLNGLYKMPVISQLVGGIKRQIGTHGYHVNLSCVVYHLYASLPANIIVQTIICM